jgi:hypothetical protein
VHPVTPCVWCIPATRMALDSAVDALSELLGSLAPSITVSPGGTTVSAASELHVASVWCLLMLITVFISCAAVCACVMVGSEVVSVSRFVADPCRPWPHGLQCVTACAVAIVPV